MINRVETSIPEDIILLAVNEAIKRSVYHPLIVSNFILENIDKISINTLKSIQECVIMGIADGIVSDIDNITWDKLYDEIQKKMEENNV